jgi:hypothetical protein
LEYKDKYKCDYFAFDIENNPEIGASKGFICSHVFGYYRTKGRKNLIKVDEHFTTIKEFGEYLLKITSECYYKVKLVAYNMGYDIATLLDFIDDSKTVMTKSYFVKAELKNGCEIFDIQNISSKDYALGYWIKILRMKKYYGVEKLSLDTIHERNRFDAMATYYLTKWFEDYFLDLGIKLSETIGMNALNLFKSSYLHYPIVRNTYKCQLMDNLYNKGFGNKCDKLVCVEQCKHYNPDDKQGFKCKYFDKCTKKDCPHKDKEAECNNYVQNTLFNKIEQFERDSYHGGRNEIFKRGIRNVDSFDVHSMYVDIEDKAELPIPDKFVYTNKINKESFNHVYNHYLCLVRCKVEIPKQYVCPLPYTMIIERSPKIVYPYGIISGVWCNNELQLAEKYGVKILEVYEVMYYYNKEKIFHEYASNVWSKRQLHGTLCMKKLNKQCNNKHCPVKAKEYDMLDTDEERNEYVKKCNEYQINDNYNPAMNIVWKLLGNSLYGKFGQKFLEYEYYGKEADIPEKDLEKMYDNENYVSHMYKYHGENYLNIKSKNLIDSKHTFTVISSFITAYARMKWLKAVKENGEESLVYGDTDSAKFISGKHTMVDDEELGGFGFEYNKIQKFFAPKLYMDLDEKQFKIKGVKKSAKQTNDNEIEGYRSYKYNTPIKYREAIKSNNKYEMGQWVNKGKDVWFYDDKRNWFGEKYYNYGIESEPLYINEDEIKEKEKESNGKRVKRIRKIKNN